MTKSKPTSKLRPSSPELRQELSDIAKDLKTSTVSFTRARIFELIERLETEPAAKAKTGSSSKARKRKRKS